MSKFFRSMLWIIPAMFFASIGRAAEFTKTYTFTSANTAPVLSPEGGWTYSAASHGLKSVDNGAIIAPDHNIGTGDPGNWTVTFVAPTGGVTGLSGIVFDVVMFNSAGNANHHEGKECDVEFAIYVDGAQEPTHTSETITVIGTGELTTATNGHIEIKFANPIDVTGTLAIKVQRIADRTGGCFLGLKSFGVTATLPEPVYVWDGSDGTATGEKIYKKPIYTISGKVISAENIPAKGFTYSFWTKRSVSRWKDVAGFADANGCFQIEHGRHDYMWFYGIPAGKGPDGSDCGFPLSSTDLQLVTVVVDCGIIKTYVDGVLVTLACEKSEALTGTTTQSFTIPEANWGALYSDDAKMSYFGLGCSPTVEGKPNPDRSETATIADVRIYDVALTTTQVKGLYDDYVNSVTTLTADVSGDVALSDIEGVADLTENDVLVLNATADATVTIDKVPNLGKIVIATATASDEVTINISSAEAATVRSIMSKLDMSATTGIVKFTLGTYTGTAAWMAYEFNGNGNNSGSDGVALSWDDGRPLDGAEYTTADSDGNQMLHLPTRPYRDVSAYPAFCTAVMYAKAGSTANGVLASFGSSVTGSTKTITLAVGETPANGDMRLVYANGRNKGTDLVQNFKVPNSQDSYHLYAFSMYTVGGKTHIDVYVDGEKLTTYTSETAITLGKGFQIASVHGGVDNIGVVRLADDDAATMDFLRVYDCLLSEEMLKTMAEAYPYTSPSGKATRTLDGTAANWVEDADPATAWSQDTLNSDATTTTTVQNAPNNGTNIVLNASAATELTVNLPEATPAYETLTINGDVTLVAGKGTEKLTVSGRTTINGNVTMPYDLVSLATVTVTSSNTLTIDASSIDLSQVWESSTIGLTGMVTCEDETAKVEVTLPTTGADGRTIDVVKTDAGYVLEVTFSGALTATVPAVGSTWADLEWKLGDTVATDLPESLTNIPVTLIAEEGATLTLEDNVTMNAVTVQGATLKVAGAYTLAIPAAGLTTTSAISLDGDTTLDLTAGDAVAGIVKAIEGDGTIKVKLTAAHSNAVNFENFTGTTDITAGYFSVDKGTIGKTLKLANGTAAQTTKTTTDATLNIVITGTAKFYANNSFPYTTSGTISGGTLDKQGAATLTVAEATSACAINVGTLVINPGAGNETTLGTLSGSSALTITSGTVKVNSGNGNYNGTITINSGATLASGTANSIPFTKGTIVNNGTLEIYGGNLAPVSGVGDVLISGATLPAPITVTGTVTIAADSTATMSENATDYNGAELKIEGGNLQVLGTLNATAGTVTIASSKALSGTGSIEGAITFAGGASIDISNGAVTVAGEVTFGATLNVTVSGEETIAGQQILVKADADITEEAAVEGLTVLVNGNEGYYVAQNAEGYVLREVITNPTLSADVAGGTTTLSALLGGNELEADTVLTINFGDGDTPGTFTFDNETEVTFAQIIVTGTAGGTIAKSETAATVTTKLATINTTVTVNAGVATFTVTEIHATGALTVADTTTVAAVTGEGVLAYNDVLPTNVTGLDAGFWTGTLTLNGIKPSSKTGYTLYDLGNASSVLELVNFAESGADVYLNESTTMPFTLKVTGTNYFTNGNSDRVIEITKIAGTGTLVLKGSPTETWKFQSVASDFSGGITVEGGRSVVLGTGDSAGSGKITITDAVNIASATLTAVNGVTVTEAGIISGTGTIASTLTLAGGATVDTTSGTLAATNTVTLPSALTVKVAAIPAVGTAVPILKTTTFASNTGAVDGTAVTVKVGDETAEGNYRLVKTPTALLLDNIPAASTSITTSTEALTEIFSTLGDASGKGIQVDLDAAVPYAPGWVSGESYALKSLFLKKRSNSGDAANAETTVTIVDANDTSIEIGTSISCETTDEGYLFTFADAVILDASKTYQFHFSATIGIRGVGVGANQSASLYLDNNLAIVIPAYVPLYTLTAERIVDTSPILSGGDAELEVTTVPEKIRLKTATFGYGSHTVLQYTGDGAADWSQMQVDGLPDGAQVVTTETTWGFEIKTLNVLTVGDSITAGLVTYYNSSANWHVPGGYRLPLYKYLTRAGYTMKYLGSSDVFGTSTSGIANPEEGNPSPSLGENVHHEGHSGARLNQMITRFGNANVQAVLASQGTPDVITLHLGTNDFGMDGDSVENALNEMKSLLYLLNGSGTDAAGTGATPLYPNATIFVAKIIPRADDGLMTNKIGPFNEQLATYVTSLASDKLVLVDLGMANNYGFLRHDGLHPSTEGYAQMAKAWFEAIDTKFDPFGEATAVPTPVASTQTTDVAESDRSGASKTAGVLKAAEWTDFTGFATGFISPIGYMPESERPWQLDVRGANVPSVTDGVLSLNGAPLTVNVVDGRIGTTASTYTVVMTVSDLVAGNVLFTDSSLACTDWPNSKGSTVADLGKLTVTDADTLAWSYNGSAEEAIDLEGANLTDTTPDTIAITITNNQCTVAVNGGTPVTISAGTGVDESYRGNFSIGAMSTAETGSSMKLYRLSFYEGAATVIMPTTEGIINVGSGDDQYTSWSTAQLAFGFGNSLESLTINFTADAQTFDFDNAEALSLKQVTITGVTGGTITKPGAGMVTATAATIDTGVTVNGVQLASTVINENASLAITDYAVLSGSVTGFGVLSITGATLTEPLSKKLVADTWTGMVVLTDVEDSKLDLAKLVNAESSLTLNGYVKAYVYDCTVKQLTLNGSFEGINGTSNSNLRQTMIITELVGAGTLYGHKTSGGDAAYVRLGITSADQFTGVVDLSAETATGTTVCFGDIATRDGAIVFSDNADATIPEGKTWKAVNGVLVWATGTISGTGTIGCDLVCESTATSTFNGTLTGDLAVTTGTLTLAKANVLTDVTVTGAANKKAVLILSDGTTICGLAKIGATEDYGENAATLTLDGAVTLLSNATMTLQRRATLDATTHVRSMLTVATGATIRGDAQRQYEILCPITFAEGAIIDTATYAKTENEANAPFTYYGGSSNIHFPEDGHVIVKIAYNNTFFSIYTQMGGAYEGLTAIEWASCVTCQSADGSLWPTENVYFVTREKYRMFDVGFQEANINGASNELEAYAAKLAYELKIYPSIQGNVTAIDNIEYDTCFTGYGASNLVKGVLSLYADFGVSNVTVVGDRVAIAVKVENGSGQAAYLRDTTVIQLSTDDGEYTEITALTDADLTNAGLSNADGLYWYWAGSLANGTGTTKYTVKAVNTSGE